MLISIVYGNLTPPEANKARMLEHITAIFQQIEALEESVRVTAHKLLVVVWIINHCVEHIPQRDITTSLGLHDGIM